MFSFGTPSRERIIVRIIMRILVRILVRAGVFARADVILKCFHL